MFGVKQKPYNAGVTCTLNFFELIFVFLEFINHTLLVNCLIYFLIHNSVLVKATISTLSSCIFVYLFCFYITSYSFMWKKCLIFKCQLLLWPYVLSNCSLVANLKRILNFLSFFFFIIFFYFFVDITSIVNTITNSSS